MLTTSVERLEGSMVKLTVTVPSSDVDDVISQAYKALAKKYRFPGFRPGHAPRPILDQHLGRDYILAEATEALVNDTYPRALDGEALRPIEAPEMEELENVEPGADYTYEAQIQLRPELTLSDAEAFAIDMPTRAATDEDVQMQIEVTRERFATLEPIEDRGVAENDFVLVSFVGTVDGEGYEGNEVDKYLYEMNRGLMPTEFDAGLIGAKPGDEVHVEFDIPDTSSNPEFVGKTAGFDITVHEVKAKVLPEIDDEFASNVGGFDSADELIADVRSRIDVQKASAYDRMLEERIRKSLSEKLEGEVPEAMIITRREQMTRDFMNMLEQQEMSMPDYLAQAGLEMDQFESDIASEAVGSVREELALEALFRARGMEVTDEDIDTELQSIASGSDQSPEAARKRWEELGLIPVIREQVMHKKAMQWLLAEVTVNEDAPAAEAKKSATGTKKSAEKKAPKKAAKKAVENEAPEAKAATDENTEE